MERGTRSRRGPPITQGKSNSCGHTRRQYRLSLTTDPVARMRLVGGDHERRPRSVRMLDRSGLAGRSRTESSQPAARAMLTTARASTSLSPSPYCLCLRESMSAGFRQGGSAANRSGGSRLGPSPGAPGVAQTPPARSYRVRRHCPQRHIPRQHTAPHSQLDPNDKAEAVGDLSSGGLATAAFWPTLASAAQPPVSHREAPSTPLTRRRAHGLPIGPVNVARQPCDPALPGAAPEYVRPGQQASVRVRQFMATYHRTMPHQARSFDDKP